MPPTMCILKDFGVTLNIIASIYTPLKLRQHSIRALKSTCLNIVTDTNIHLWAINYLHLFINGNFFRFCLFLSSLRAIFDMHKIHGFIVGGRAFAHPSL